MYAIQNSNGDCQTFRFGFREWIGLGALALTPALGFAGWAWRTGERITILETTQKAIVATMDRFTATTEATGRFEQHLLDMDRRLNKIEDRRQ